MSTSETIPQIELGSSGIEAGAVGLGTYHLLDKLSERDAVELVIGAVQDGMTLVDLSDNYAGSQLVVSKALETGEIERDEIVVATKTGIPPSWHEASARRGAYDTSAEALRRRIDDSLFILGVETVDLYQLHVPDPAVEPIEHAETMAELKDSGKIRAWGVSNYGIMELEQLLLACDSHGLERPATLQNFHNILSSYSGDSALDLARREGLTVLAHSPLLKGGLTDLGVHAVITFLERQREGIADLPDVQPEDLLLLHELYRYAEPRGLTVGQLAIAGLLAQDRTLVINGATTQEQRMNSIEAAQHEMDDEGKEMLLTLHARHDVDAIAGRLVKMMTSRIKTYFKKI